MNILILSAGGPTAHGVIKSLRDIKFSGKIVSIDAESLSAGFHLSDEYYVVPRADDENYISDLYQIVNKEKIDLILPTSGNDIIPISKNSHLFGGKLFMSDYEAIMDCSDKMRFYEKCKDGLNILLESYEKDSIIYYTLNHYCKLFKDILEKKDFENEEQKESPLLDDLKDIWKRSEVEILYQIFQYLETIQDNEEKEVYLSVIDNLVTMKEKKVYNYINKYSTSYN